MFFSFITGIEGMQPPSVKSGQRPPFISCYDPDRPSKEDYAGMALPSSAMVAIQEGDMLVEDEGELCGITQDVFHFKLNKTK